jgi:hypothetical protein
LSTYEFIRLVTDTKPNKKVNLTIIHDKQGQNIAVEIGKMPSIFIMDLGINLEFTRSEKMIFEYKFFEAYIF